MKLEGVSIIVPVYNEEKSIEGTLTEIKSTIKTLSFNTEIIVVDDCSDDNSKTILDRTKGVKVISHTKNKGYGASLKTGIKNSKYDIILITDADGTYPIKDIPFLLKYANEWDMVIGSRKGRIVKVPFFRRPAKWFLNNFASYISSMRIPDLNSGLRVFKKDLALKFWNLFPEGFSFTSTITVAALTKGYNVKFVPINYYKRKGSSTMHPIKDFIRFNKLLLKLALFFKPLKVFIPLSISLFSIGIALLLVGWFVFHRLFDTTFVIIMLFSLQMFMMGIIAELIINK